MSTCLLQDRVNFWCTLLHACHLSVFFLATKFWNLNCDTFFPSFFITLSYEPSILSYFTPRTYSGYLTDSKSHLVFKFHRFIRNLRRFVKHQAWFWVFCFLSQIIRDLLLMPRLSTLNGTSQHKSWEVVLVIPGSTLDPPLLTLDCWHLWNIFIFIIYILFTFCRFIKNLSNVKSECDFKYLEYRTVAPSAYSPNHSKSFSVREGGRAWGAM